MPVELRDNKMKFEDNFLFAKPVKSGFLKEANRKVYWLNGLGEEHNAFTKLVSEEKTRQQGWEKAVYGLACDKDGTRLYKNVVGISEFHKNVDRTMTRDYGMLILGISKGEEPDAFEQEVKDELKKSEAASGDSTS